MQEKNEKGGYSELSDFKKDALLIVANAKAFNREGEPVWAMATEFGSMVLLTASNAIDELNTERKKKKREKKKKKEKKKTATA